MKKYLLLISLFFSASIIAQDIIYWDFGAKELGAGHTNALPLEHLNAFANYTRNISWVDGNGAVVTNYDDGVAYVGNTGFENENGRSANSIYNDFTSAFAFDAKYAPGTEFKVSSKGSASDPGGTLLSGG